MRFKTPLIEGTFVERLNRFAVHVELEGRLVKAHMANSGRLKELLVKGRPAYLSPALSSQRVTTHNLHLMRTEKGTLVSVDARLPNVLFYEAFLKGELTEFSNYPMIEKEVKVGASRLDFRLKGSEKSCTVEVKSITLVKGGVGFFPDAITSRGVRHLNELAELNNAGERAEVVFIVQRADVECVRPHDEADPIFGRTLRDVVSQGVEVYAYRCRVGLTGVWLDSMIPVEVE
jgi:sugar fermentation stimulation protein A